MLKILTNLTLLERYYQKLLGAPCKMYVKVSKSVVCRLSIENKGDSSLSALAYL